MQENFSFRTSFKGFNREDVIAYINKILEESTDNINRIAILENDITALKKEIDALKIQNEELAEENKNLNEAKQNGLFNADRFTDKSFEEKCEARLGSAMMDAKRFSDLLIQEANDKCSDLFGTASEAAKKSSLVARAISEELQKVSSSVSSTLGILTKNMKTIADSLQSFSNETDNKKEVYNFNSDFKNEPEPTVQEEPQQNNPEILENMLSDILKLSEEFEL